MITIVKVGYFHPSAANWAYGVWLIVDDTGAKLYKETFGGDSITISTLRSEGIKAETYFLPTIGLFRGRDAVKMPDIETYTGKNYDR